MVSVIIPVYNVEKYLRECLDSVLAQTYKDLEVILVDDGSTDQSGSICDEYAAKDSRFKVIHKPNGGQSDARNVGLDNAQGDYVYFIDSDDYIPSNTIMLAVTCAEKEKADIVYFDCETIYEDFNDSKYSEDLKRHHFYRPGKGARIYAAHLKYGECFSCLYMQLFKRSIIEKTGCRFVKLSLCEDELFTPLVYLNSQKAVQLKKSLYYRRLRANSVMSKKDSTDCLESIAVCILEYINELKKYKFGSDERKLLIALADSHIHTMMLTYYHLDREERKKACPTVMKVAARMKDIHYKHNFKTELKIKIPTLYFSAWSAYQPVKKRLKRK